jgi:hypothetical protein
MYGVKKCGLCFVCGRPRGREKGIGWMEKLEQDLNALVRFIGTSDRGRRKGRVENVLISHRMQDPVHTTRKRLEILDGRRRKGQEGF